MSEKQDLKQAQNKVEIEGLLLEIDSREGKSRDGENNWLSARLTIETGEGEQHQVELFQMQYTKSGDENTIYKSLETVIDEYKTVKDVGRDDADWVTTYTGEIRRNDYVNDRGLQSFPQIQTTFINRVDEEPKPKAKFEVELVVESVEEELNKDQEETGRAVLKGYTPLFGGVVIPVDFVVAEDGAGYVLDNYEPGDTVFVYGDIVNHREEVVKETASAFGVDKKDVKYNYVREYLITGGTAPYDADEGDEPYDTELIKKALTEREVYLEGLKTEYKNRVKDSKKKGGFDARPSKKRDVKKKDMPF